MAYMTACGMPRDDGSFGRACPVFFFRVDALEIGVAGLCKNEVIGGVFRILSVW